MKPGERVDLIKKLAESLANTSWEHVDLVLRQFALPWSPNWEGNLESYILRRLERGEDAHLVELQNYLFPQASGDAAASGPGRWTGRVR
jgi:hypothetical protein